MTGHSLATVLLPFYPGNIGDADAAIIAFDATAARKLDAPGVKIIHFASITTVKVSDLRAYIVIELTADAPARQALRIFALLLEVELVALLVAAGIPVPPRLDQWLESQSIRIGQSPFVNCGLLFDGSPGMSVARIIFESELATKIEESGWLQNAGSAQQKLDAVRANLWSDAGRLNFKPAFIPQPTPILNPAPPRGTFLERLRIAAIIAYRFLVWPLPLLPALFLLFTLLPVCSGWFGHVVLPLLGAIAVIALALLALAMSVRRLELKDPFTPPRQSVAAANAILMRENKSSQNALVTTSILKPGLTRRIALQLAFYTIRTVLPLYWAAGRLGDLNDIHFMRWLLLPHSRVLIFRSHYDGAWVNYIEDFALRAPTGVSAIWSNTENFPPTRWLTQGGAADGPRFRAWVHTQTRPALFTYSAYPDLSIERIRLNARIAHAIATGIPDEPVKAWLTSLGDAQGVDF